MRPVKKYLRSDTEMDPRPRGRPRSFDPDVALNAAGERFRAQGYAATSLDDLVEATGLARPSLYAAFGDKKALYLAALARVTERLDRQFDGLAALDLSAEALVRRMLTFAIDGFLRGDRGPAGCIVLGTATSEATRDPDVRAALAKFVTLEDDRIAGLLAAAGSAAPATYARIVSAVIHSLSVRARAGAPRADLERLAEECIALVAPGATG